MIDNFKLEELKEGLTAYVDSIAERDPKQGRNKYKCPLCGSGYGKGDKRRRTGAFSIEENGKKWRCFSCDKSGDIFNLIGLHEKIANFREQAEWAANFLKTDLSFTGNKTIKPKDNKAEQEAAKATLEEWRNQSAAYIKACKEVVHKTEYFKNRGFTDEVIDNCNLGYDEKKKIVVIPYEKNGGYYITRNLVKGKEDRFYSKPPRNKAGEEPLYNGAALYCKEPCFVTEGAIDAISIIQGATEAGFKCGAVALGGTGAQKLINRINKEKPNCTLILNFDNDDAGKKATEETAEKLAALNIPFIKAEYNWEEYPEKSRKDANDLLRGNRKKFQDDIKRNLGAAYEVWEEAEKEKNAEKLTELEEYNEGCRGTELIKAFEGDMSEEAIKEYIPTGFTELDKLLDGGLFPSLYVLGAVSSLGKSTFALQIGDQIAERGTDVLYFALEMSKMEMIGRSLSRLTYVLSDGNKRLAKSAGDLMIKSKRAKFSKATKELIEKAIGEYNKFGGRLYYYESLGDIDVDFIRATVAKHKELTGNTPVVIVDYLQIIAPSESDRIKRLNDKQVIDRAVLALKRISRDFKTPVFAISSFNRENYTNHVSMAAFKESGAIEYSSDVLLAIQPEGVVKLINDKEDKIRNSKTVDKCMKSLDRDIEVVILKNRFGKAREKAYYNYHTVFNYMEQVPEIRQKDNGTVDIEDTPFHL